MKLIYLNKRVLSIYVFEWIKEKIEPKKEYRYFNKLIISFECAELFSSDIFISIIFVEKSTDIYRVVFYKNGFGNRPINLTREELEQIIKKYGYSEKEHADSTATWRYTTKIYSREEAIRIGTSN